MSHYDSDDSTLVNEDRSRRQRHRPSYRSTSRERYDSRQSNAAQTNYGYSFQDFGGEKSKVATFGKVAILLGIVGVLVHKWHKEKEEREKEYRHRKRKEFERAKRARRREEERRERDEELAQVRSPPQVVKRIEYMPQPSREKALARQERSDHGSERSGGSRGRRSPADLRGARSIPGSPAI